MDKKYHVEGLIFASNEPISLKKISKIVEEEENIVMRWIFELQTDYRGRGIQIRQVAGGFEMVTSPDIHSSLEKLIPPKEERLSPSAIETLSAIAYNQPITREKIARLRGVQNPDHGINLLLEKDLIVHTEEGFIVTENFLKYFGINDIKQIPQGSKLYEHSEQQS